jgi:midasin (ATPase involved in ribosome maturation)
MCCLLKRKINVDNYLNKIVDICVKANCEMLSLNELDKLLIAHNLERYISHKLHVI